MELSESKEEAFLVRLTYLYSIFMRLIDLFKYKKEFFFICECADINLKYIFIESKVNLKIRKIQINPTQKKASAQKNHIKRLSWRMRRRWVSDSKSFNQKSQHGKSLRNGIVRNVIKSKGIVLSTVPNVKHVFPNMIIIAFG
jgi:hypothetical protein